MNTHIFPTFRICLRLLASSPPQLLVPRAPTTLPLITVNGVVSPDVDFRLLLVSLFSWTCLKSIAAWQIFRRDICLLRTPSKIVPPGRITGFPAYALPGEKSLFTALLVDLCRFLIF